VREIELENKRIEGLLEELVERDATISQLTKYLNEMLGAEKGACQIDHRGDCRSHERFGVCGHCPVAAARAYRCKQNARLAEAEAVILGWAKGVDVILAWNRSMNAYLAKHAAKGE